MLQATSRNRLLAVTIIALLAGGGAVAGVALRPAVNDGPIQEAVRQAATLSDAFIAISEAVTGSVVQIEVVRLQMPPEPAMTGELRDLFNRPTAPRQAVPQVAGGRRCPPAEILQLVYAVYDLVAYQGPPAPATVRVHSPFAR